jgi:hypothetical protein
VKFYSIVSASTNDPLKWSSHEKIYEKSCLDTLFLMGSRSLCCSLIGFEITLGNEPGQQHGLLQEKEKEHQIKMFFFMLGASWNLRTTVWKLSLAVLQNRI